MRFLAFYLPQFHPIPENDEWWGTGFTEWTNVVRGRPLFKGHYQPHLPGALGFYDLRLPEVREAQAQLALDHGIHGFCYYHYWFGGQQLLERPFREVVRTGQPDFPFCLCWANENWTRVWNGKDHEPLMTQRYSPEDDLAHIRAVAEAFADPRYIRVDGRPLFLVYRASDLPEPEATTDRWRNEASRLGIGELYLAMVQSFPADRGDPRKWGFDAGVQFAPDFTALARRGHHLRRATRRLLRPVSPMRRNRVVDYRELIQRMLNQDSPDWVRYPCVTPGFDNSPRRPDGGATIITGATPDRYEDWLRHVIASFQPPAPDEDLVFINAWNEWGEGNHLEPCQRWGAAFLEAHGRAARGLSGSRRSRMDQVP